MNDTDYMVMRQIQGIYDKTGKYPSQVEVTEEIQEKMTCNKFYFILPIDMAKCWLLSTEPLTIQEVMQEQENRKVIVDVVPVGDLVFTKRQP